ncbi:YbjN domain-containing protein [Cohnella boryungensis]|uniref:YbjN domain-containing protein n=1 Tax=Cohnella boryungensis TaxID=768479 RepID=A0ABV8SHU3_9BACL
MISELEHAKHLAELGGLQAGFEEEGLQTELLERSPDIPLHVLLLALGKDRQNRDRIINLSFVPMPESDIEWIRLLQLYSIVPCVVAPDRRSAVESVLLAANGVLPLGHFGIKEDGEVYARYVYTVPSSRTVSGDELLEVVSLFHYMLEMFADRIERVASGELSADEALQELG